MRAALALLALAGSLAAPISVEAQGWTVIPRNRPTRMSEDLTLAELAGLYAPVLPRLAGCYLREIDDTGPPPWLPELSRVRLRFREGRLSGAALSRTVRAHRRFRRCIESIPEDASESSVPITVEVVQVFQVAFTPMDLRDAAMRCTGPGCRPRPPDAPGRLSFDSSPWCDVTVDGERVGQTPVVNLELEPGTHTLECRNPERGTTRLEVEVTPGRTARRRIVLR